MRCKYVIAMTCKMKTQQNGQPVLYFGVNEHIPAEKPERSVTQWTACIPLNQLEVGQVST